MPLSPYLSFAGNCADAIAYYQRTLGVLIHLKYEKNREDIGLFGIWRD